MWLTLCVFLIIIRRNVNGLYCRHFNVLEECKKCRARVECNCLCSRLAAISHCAPYPPRPHQLTLTSIHTSLLRWREAQFNLLFCLLAVYCCFVLCVALTCHFITRWKTASIYWEQIFLFSTFKSCCNNRREELKTHFKN